MTPFAKPLLEDIASKYRIKLVFVDEEYKKQTGEDFVNRSFYAGDDEIFIGEFKDDDMRNLSFFHELGHCMDGEKEPHPCLPNVSVLSGSRFDVERRAWQIGLRLAESFGYTFSTSALVWMLGELGSYARKEYVGI